MQHDTISIDGRAGGPYYLPTYSATELAYRAWERLVHVRKRVPQNLPRPVVRRVHFGVLDGNATESEDHDWSPSLEGRHNSP